jgi:hypothetical protein
MGISPSEISYLETFKDNLEKGIELILEISKEAAYPNENLKSIPEFVKSQQDRLKSIYSHKNELSLAVNF